MAGALVGTLVGFMLAGALASCAAPDAFGGSHANAASWAAARGFSGQTLRAGDFELAAFVRAAPIAATHLAIYIEGDGAPWPSPFRPPADPTPIKPIALALAAADGDAAIAYLGRPCQYLDAAALKSCAVAYWTERRFAPEVVAAYDAAIDQLKARLGSRRITLVGHSGGGVLAALLATRRDDVDALVTVAAPLAVKAWERHHGATPLTGSLDPDDDARPLPASVHFVGAGDKTVPAGILQGFVDRHGGRVVIVPDFDHECCWTRDWPALARQAKETPK